MLREILRDNLDILLLTVEKIGRAFEILASDGATKDELLEVKRLIHSLKGNLQSIGLNDESDVAIRLEDEIFKVIDDAQTVEIHISKEMIDVWFSKLNAIEFSLKSYLF